MKTLSQREIIKQIVAKDYGSDYAMYLTAKIWFANKDFISTALLQRTLKISYLRARNILDQMVENKFCMPQTGSYPCKIIKFKN